MGGPRVDLSGQTYGRLFVLSKDGRQDTCGNFTYLCRCSCGNEKVVSGKLLKRGETVSCGCFQRDSRYTNTLKHGHFRDRKPTKVRVAWSSMKDRCLNPKNKQFKDYGGRGVTVHEPWINDFESFLAHVGEPPSQKHSIDRIDTNGNYEPGNVRWATPIEQQHNKRKTVKRISFAGVVLTISEWGKMLGFAPHVLHGRIRRGWSISDTLTKPFGYRESTK